MHFSQRSLESLYLASIIFQNIRDAFLTEVAVDVNEALDNAQGNLLQALDLAHEFIQEGVFTAQDGELKTPFKTLTKQKRESQEL